MLSFLRERYEVTVDQGPIGVIFFFFNDTATTEIYTLSLHDALPICAGCQVRQPCLEVALHGPQAHHDHHGIFAGTTAKQRSKLRGRPSMAKGTRFLQDRAAAQEALTLANQVSIDRAAQQLGE